MKVLTLWQPWASLVALGVKTIETRSWSTKYRGPLAIHAAAKQPPHRCAIGSWWSCAADDPGNSPLPARMWANNGTLVLLPLGAIVATCTLVDVVPIIANDDCEWHDEHPRSVGACAHAAIDGQVITHTPTGVYHTTVLVEQAYGDFTPGRYAWLLADVVPVDPPAPFKGGQGLTKSWEPAAA